VSLKRLHITLLAR